MRFLKKKIALSAASLKAKEALTKASSLFKRRSQGQRNKTQLNSSDPNSTKNIAKNFGKAICNFAYSELSLPYLTPLLKEKQIEQKDFRRFAVKAKDKIDGLFSFRSVLMISENESKKTKAIKEIFKSIGVIFIKFFSVNWIFHGKIFHKRTHLNFRFKMKNSVA